MVILWVLQEIDNKIKTASINLLMTQYKKKQVDFKNIIGMFLFVDFTQFGE